MTTLCMPLQHLPSRQHTVSKHHDLVSVAVQTEQAGPDLHSEPERSTRNTRTRHRDTKQPCQAAASCNYRDTQIHNVCNTETEAGGAKTLLLRLTAWLLHAARCCCCKVQTQPNRGKTGRAPETKIPGMRWVSRPHMAGQAHIRITEFTLIPTILN